MTTAGMNNPQSDLTQDAQWVAAIREDFPQLSASVHGKPLVYLDNAATTQKPNQVIKAITGFYESECSNIHRGVHQLSVRATDAYEKTRETVRRFINAASEREVIFCSGTTAAINIVANCHGAAQLDPSSEILITHLEHHSNIVPWQLIAEKTGASLRVAPINDEGEVEMDKFLSMLNSKTRIVSVSHVSNALGTINPVKEMIDAAHEVGAVVMLDGAQAVAHLPVDVAELDCDFYAFSGHKLYGPTGVGVLYGKEALLEAMPPYQGGGDMILQVTFEKTIYNRLPYRFEAGTPNIAGVIGLGAAIDYLLELGIERAARWEDELLASATQQVTELGGVKIVGQAKEKTSVLSFVMDDIHPHDIGTILDKAGVAIRAGHHCAQPVMDRYKVPATARASFSVYNTQADVDALIQSVLRVQEMFGNV